MTVPLWQQYLSKNDILSGLLRRYDPHQLIKAVEKLNFKNVEYHSYGRIFFRFIHKHCTYNPNLLKKYRLLQEMRRLLYYFFKIEDVLFKNNKGAQGIFLFQKLN